MHKCAKVRQCFRIAVSNKSENDVPSDIVRRMYQGVLYFQIVTHGFAVHANVILFTPVRTVLPSMHQFAQKPRIAKCRIVHISDTEL